MTRGRASPWHLLVTLAVFLLSVPHASCESPKPGPSGVNSVTPYTGRLITEVKYVGLKTTTRATAERWGKIHAGMTLTPALIDETKARLAATKLFHAVEFSYVSSGEGVTVIITVQENWALFPVPYNVRFSSDFYGGGVLLVDRNFLGEAKTLSAGFSYSNHGPYASLSYTDPWFLTENLSLTTFVEGGIDNRVQEYANGETFENFTYSKLLPGIVLSDQVRPDLKIFTEWRGFAFGLDGSNSSSDDLQSSLIVTPSVGAIFDGTRDNAYFKSGLWVGVQTGMGVSFWGMPSYGFARGRLNETLLFFYDGFLDVGLAGEWGSENTLNMLRLHGKGFRTLPTSTYSNKNLGSFASYNYPILKFGWGAVALSAFYEAGTYQTGSGALTRTSVFYGPGGGLYLYLKNISIPAVDLDLGYNTPEQSVSFSIIVGLSLD